MKKSWIAFLSAFVILSALCVVMHSCHAGDENLGGEEEAGTKEEVSYTIKYSEYVEKYSEQYGVDREIIYAVIKCESNFKADARSSVGALGLMQMMPATFADMQSRLGEEYESEALMDPEVSIKYGTYYLKYLYNYFGDWELVFAAYNAGMGNVSKWLKNEEYSDGGKLIDIPFPETKKYVKKVIAARDEYTKLLTEVK